MVGGWLARELSTMASANNPMSGSDEERGNDANRLDEWIDAWMSELNGYCGLNGRMDWMDWMD